MDDKGELVGVTEGASLNAQLLSTFVDITEVRKLLHRRSVVALRGGSTADGGSKEPTKPARDKAVEGKDEAKYFTAETWKKAQAAADRLYKEKKFDLLVETIEPPAKDADKLKAMSGTEKLKYFREHGEERIKAAKLSGIYILVSKAPTFLYVVETPDVVATLPKEFRKKLQDELFAAFKEKKFDDGLLKGVDMVLDARGLADKK